MFKVLEKNKFLSVIFLILIAVEIFYFSSLSAVPGEQGSAINLSVFYHTIIFFLFTIFATTTIKSKKDLTGKQMIFIILISLIFAVLDEAHQIFVPGRVAGIKDILTDLIGILFAILIYPKKSQ